MSGNGSVITVKEFYKTILDMKELILLQNNDMTEIKTNMSNIKKVAESFSDIKNKVDFHNKFIWILISFLVASGLGSAIYWGTKRLIL